jgi:Uma2 family endonuclease
MATNPRTVTITLDDYLAAEEVAEFRSEFIGGEVVAMVGASFRHNRIIHNLHLALGNQLRGGPCGMMSQAMKVRTGESEDVYYPDVVVYCGEPRIEQRQGEILLNPALLIEVLSPSSAAYDRGPKWDQYRRIASLQEYVVIWQDMPRVERFTRQGDGFWLFSEARGLDATVVLDTAGLTLRLADVYEGVLTADEASA